MKILIVSYYFPPLNSVGSLRPYSFAKTFSELGHDVTVLTAPKPSSPSDLTLSMKGFTVIDVESRFLQYFYELFKVNVSAATTSAKNGRRVLKKLRSFRLKRGILLLGRMPDILDCLVRPSIRRVRGETWDLVITSYAPYSSHAIGYHLRRHGKCAAWVADFRDLWTAHHHFTGLFPFTVIEKHLERKYLKTADIVTTVSPELASELQSSITTPKVHVIENGFDEEDLRAIDPEAVFSDGKVRLVYTGTAYSGNTNFSRFLDAILLLKRQVPDAHTKLEVIFAGADLAGLRNIVDVKSLSDMVSQLDFLPRHEALRLQRDAHVQLFFDTEGATGIATGKLYEYISSGSLVWRIGSPKNTIASRIIRDTGTGVNVGNTPECICRRLVELLAHREKPRPATNETEIARYRRSRLAERLMDLVSASAA